MKKAVAIQHLSFENLGVFEPELQSSGFSVEYLDATAGDFNILNQTPPDLLIILGAPIGAFDDELYPFLTAELDAIQQRIEKKLPTLGICLGAQLIARALGAKVSPMGYKEIGYAPLKLTEAGANSCLAPLKDIPVLHWHGDQFEIPSGATLLAGSELCPHQAFAFEDHVLALQFHIEADYQKIEHWLVGHTAELAAASINPQELRQQAKKFGPKLNRIAPEVLHRIQCAGRGE
ncbi:MAG: glutamine amidotransferase [Chthoniobacterales bacterium]